MESTERGRPREQVSSNFQNIELWKKQSANVYNSFVCKKEGKIRYVIIFYICKIYIWLFMPKFLEDKSGINKKANRNGVERKGG